MSVCTRLSCVLGLLALAASSVSASILGEPHRVPIAEDTSVVQVADLNGDGRDDLVTSIPARRLIGILLARPDGTFTNMPALNGFGSLATADLTGDGKIDLLIIDHTTLGGSTVVVYRGQGDGTFQLGWTTRLSEAWSLSALSDLNNDGALDIVLGTDFRLLLPVAAMLGQGNGTFASPVVSAYAAGGVLVDVTGDGFPDLVGRVRIGHTMPTALLPGNGDGTFGPPRDLTDAESLLAQARGDFNGDGITDVAIIRNRGDNEEGTLEGVLAVQFGNGDGTFGSLIETVVEPAWNPPGIARDFDGDGRDDLVYATVYGSLEQYPGYVQVIFGTATGKPDVIEKYYEDLFPHHLLVGDFNGDGFADLALESYGLDYHTYDLSMRFNTTFALRSVSFIEKPGKPLRVALDGANFTPETRVFVGDSETPWPTVAFKSSTRIILKGGDELDSAFPRGVAVAVRVVNSDGRSATTNATR